MPTYKPLFYLLIGLLFQSCTKDFTPEKPIATEEITKESVILGDGSGTPIYIGYNYTFKNNPNAIVDYVIKDMIIIYDSTTTIEPGTVILFEGSHTGIKTKNKGALYAEGTQEFPIRFSSTEKWKGSWKGIFVGTHRFENVFNNCEFEYAGHSPIEEMPVSAALGVHQDEDENRVPVIHVNNCTFKNNNAYGFYCASLKSEIPSFTHNKFEGQNGTPAAIPFIKAGSISSTNSFLSLSNPNLHRFILLFNDGFNQNTDLENDLMLQKLDVPYRFKGDEGITIISAGLTIQAGVHIEFDNDGGLLIKDGFLQANGTSIDPIVFKGTSGKVGQWVGISFQTNHNNNQLTYCDIVSGGSKMAPWCDGKAAITLGNWFGNQGKALVENCRITNSGGHGISMKSTSQLTQSGNTFTLNASSPDIHIYP